MASRVVLLGLLFSFSLTITAEQWNDVDDQEVDKRYAGQFSRAIFGPQKRYAGALGKTLFNKQPRYPLQMVMLPQSKRYAGAFHQSMYREPSELARYRSLMERWREMQTN